MDIPADEYTAQWTISATTAPQWTWHFSSQCFLNEEYSVLTYTTYSLIQPQRDCIHTIGLKKLKWIFECKILYIYCKFVLIYSIPFVNFNFTAVTNTIPHIFDTLLWYLHKLHCLKLVSINVLYILCIGHLPDVVPEMAKQREALEITFNGNTMQYSYIFSLVYSIHIKTIKTHNTSPSTIQYNKYNTLMYCHNISIN